MVMDIPIANYNPDNDILGLPQELKGIKFYPIRVLDTETKELFNFIFSYSRSQMYLSAGEHILERKVQYPWLNVYVSKYQQSINKQGNETLKYLKAFLSKITNYDYNRILIGCLNGYEYDCENSIDKEIVVQFIKENEEKNSIDIIQFSAKEFDEVRKLIITQNGRSFEYIDEWNESFEEDLQEYVKIQKIDFTSFSDDILTYKELSHLTYKDITAMTLCQFLKGFEKAKQIKDYELTYPLYASGKIGNIKDIRHYSLPVEKAHRYDSMMEDFETASKRFNEL